MFRIAKPCSAVALLMFAGSVAAQPCAREWATLPSQEPGLTSPVHVVGTFDDGNGPALYVGGSFTSEANRIIKWDGQNWSPLGGGVNNLVTSMCVFDDGAGPDLYVGGSFTNVDGATARRIGRWDGTSWSILGSATTGPNVGAVRAMVVFDDGSGPALYAGGEFSTVGFAGSGRIARWNGTAWSGVGGGMSGGNVLAMCVHNDGTGDALYAAGAFTTAGGQPANRIAKWDGVSWSPLGDGISNNEVFALASFDDGSGPALYAAGWFNIAGDEAVGLIAKWDGATWSPVGGGHNSDILCLTVFDDGNGDALYAGGFFDTGGNRISRWDGSTWSPLGQGIDWNLGGVQNGSAVLTMTTFDDGSGAGPALVAAGDFSLAGDYAVQNIATWSCPAAPPCAADFDDNGTREVVDIFAFLTAWFALDPSADIDGIPGVEVPDIFTFLTLWFAGCP